VTAPRPPLPPGPYLVVGLARSGAGAMGMLAPHGEVIGVDSGPASLRGFEVHENSDGVDLLDRVRTVVKSPGVPQEAPVVKAARARGIEVTGELELAWRLLPRSRFVAVTGTNGKTTTVHLLGAIHEGAAVAGNVGTPLSSLVGADPPLVICEASSFQLEDASRFAPDVAVLLNLAEDHLDRHGSFDAYRDAKLRAFVNQTPDQVAVLPRGFEVPGDAERVTFGPRHADLASVDGILTWRGAELMPAAEVRIRGAHNLENAMAAAAAALASGTDPGPVRAALASFAGVPHRLEEVVERDGVLYVNDSKATNVDAARVGIEAFEPGTVHAILGGSLKGGGFEGLRGALGSRARAAYLIGAAAERLEADLEGSVPLQRCGDLASAVAAARAAARPGEVVLLSPACASYDQYANFEERGQHFRELARG
jgi:UDP-N-acetylmuramoylalanine--D-glutamate ligase